MLISPLAQAQGKGVIVQPSSAEMVNKLLNPGPSDPDVPLPQAGLTTPKAPAERSLRRPTIYGRPEEGGALLGVRVPIPADRRRSGG